MEQTPPIESELFGAQEGAGYVEKLLLVALFAMVVAGGIRLIAGGASSKLVEQGESLGAVNATIGGSPSAPSTSSPNDGAGEEEQLSSTSHVLRGGGNGGAM